MKEDTVTCSQCGDTHNRSDDSRHECKQMNIDNDIEDDREIDVDNLPNMSKDDFAYKRVLLDTECVIGLAIDRINAHFARQAAMGETVSKGTFGVTQLSKDIAKVAQCSFTFAYAITSAYIQSRDDIEVKKGPKGGIVPKKKVPTNG